MKMKSLSKTVFVAYLLVLAWLVLFKFSTDVSAVLDYHMRSLKLVPFAGLSGIYVREMIANFVVFIPFGLLLGVNLKRTSFWRKLAFILSFSLAVEILQFVLAIGTTDVTDVITNTAGGFLGLALYHASHKHIDGKKLDRWIVVAGAILLITLVLFRVLFLRIRYQSAH